MKNLDLTVLDVESLDNKELENVEGGILLGLAVGLAVAAALDYYVDPEGFKESFWNGFNAF